MNTESRLCLQCCEPINLAAKKCPHCHSWQRKWIATLANPGAASLFGIVPLILLYALLLRPMLQRDDTFAHYREQIVVIDPSIHYSDDPKGNMISTIGWIKNNSPLKWKRITIEVQYFDESGKLIDTKSNQDYDFILLPLNEHAFRVRFAADKPETAYRSQKIFIRDAERGDRWP